jgi:hypothetical protein
MSTDLQPQYSDIIFYASPEGNIRVEVLFSDETFWLNQKRMSELFGVEVNTINYHLKEIFKSGELQEVSTIRKIRIVQKEGIRNIPRNIDFYNLDAIIGVGYRVNSFQATQFRIWATKTLKEFIIKGFVLDDERLKQGKRFGKDYFDELLERIREIRASERRFYQKITDIYQQGSIDYDKDAEITQTFFKTVQNKLHWAITKQTAPQIVASEIKELERVVSMYLDYAENQASRQIPMKMADWVHKLDGFLQFNDYYILKNAGTISHEVAKRLAEQEYEKYRISQDQLYESDFDKEVKKITTKSKLGKNKKS